MRTVDPVRHRERRMAIVGAALELFATQGLAGTTTAEIARAAGISSGALFHYFPSKRAVFLALFDADREEWDEAFAAARRQPDPWTALTGIVDRLAAEAAHPLMAGLVVEVLAQAHRDPEVAGLVAANDRRMLAGVAELVERMCRDGSADPGMPAATAARWVLTLTDAFQTRGYPEPDRDRAAEAATATLLIARVLRRTGPGSPGRPRRRTG
ncbi:TetR/AcrR family transcriptional regulator [Trujillonella endophytica]|uniref:Transcriptional regulator, TetR family n=1 Tax=Trujillonella endophytica TaxID=673521 RepID=A0A1H8UND4_9ACTN|nr:TetR/AcrR family transcriptional regulator [Trujillella endophytica]SEP04712.1 transcriptional regulator, TetR family [Trujillella endophytica]